MIKKIMYELEVYSWLATSVDTSVATC